MIKKLFAIFISFWGLTIACQKEQLCYDNLQFQVNGFELKVNDENIGVDKKNEGENKPGVISTTRNQFMFLPNKVYPNAKTKSLSGFDFISSAYAAKCVDVENSITSFDERQTSFSIDIDLPLAWYGISSDTIKAGSNLLENQDLKSGLLKDILLNSEIHHGFDFPVTISPDFLRTLNGKTITFTLKLYTTTIGTKMESSTTALVDIRP
ncbi:MAG: hypothetical protein M9887_05965 [Chitinophagales bacterium]|nr:hypothetical protein [Chitinophagales bacterium]